MVHCGFLPADNALISLTSAGGDWWSLWNKAQRPPILRPRRPKSHLSFAWRCHHDTREQAKVVGSWVPLAPVCGRPSMDWTSVNLLCPRPPEMKPPTSEGALGVCLVPVRRGGPIGARYHRLTTRANGGQRGAGFDSFESCVCRAGGPEWDWRNATLLHTVPVRPTQTFKHGGRRYAISASALDGSMVGSPQWLTFS